MKKLILSAALTITSILAVAQDSYTVKMNMKFEGLPKEYQAYSEQEVINYFKGDKFKSEMNSMMATVVTVFDGKKMTQLTEVMGDKSGFTATKEEMESGKEKSDKPKIEYTSDKKMVAGYECTKAILTVTDKEKKENKMNAWVTDKIKNPNPKNSGRQGMNIDMSELKGYPLEMEMSQSMQGMDMKIVITTSEVKTDNLEDSAFTVSTEGYKMMTYKEHQDKMKAMRGGH